ncbi:hypothetical protein DPMN_181856 [Dreissena polymorpha]|uniref:Uncharacterized protein n=1 Tax=Dreissena polymorpha TaxID=45954 RepID=A0A9D4I455_DREPO|nr:hypothetical protein DPMN_181856 [Dreissena polymorpha]
MTKGRIRVGLSTSRSYSTGLHLRTHRRFCQHQAICQLSAALPQRRDQQRHQAIEERQICWT